MKVGSGVEWPKGGMPPTAKPVSSRTEFASGRFSASPRCAAIPFSFTRLLPETSSKYGLLLSAPVKTSDFTICPTLTPQAAAASSAVRVDCDISCTAMHKPSACAAA
jgi:hypothetical protein